MPGFLGRYNEVVTVWFSMPCEACAGTGKIDESDCAPCKGSGRVKQDMYFAKVRRFPPRSAYRAAQGILVAPIMRYGSEKEGVETKGNVDSSGYQNELVAWNLIEWNLTDIEDRPVPLGSVDPVKGPDATRRVAVDWLPEDPFEEILAVIDGGKKKADKKVEGGSEPTDPFRQIDPEGAVLR